MRARVLRWGNSLAIRIPAALARKAKLHEGERIELRVESRRIIIARTERFTLARLLREVTPENLHSEIDSGSSVGGEVW